MLRVSSESTAVSKQLSGDETRRFLDGTARGHGHDNDLRPFVLLEAQRIAFVQLPLT